MDEYQSCEDVIRSLKSAWTRGPAWKCLDNAALALRDAAQILAPSDFPSIETEILERKSLELPIPPSTGNKSFELTPHLLLETARCCIKLALYCLALSAMDRDSKLLKSFLPPAAVLHRQRTLAYELLPECKELFDKTRACTPSDYLAQTEGFLYSLGLVIYAVHNSILPVLESWACFLLWENALKRCIGYAAKNPDLMDLLRAIRSGNKTQSASIISRADMTKPQVASTLSVLTFLLEPGGELFTFLERNLAGRVTSRSLSPEYYTAARTSEPLYEIAHSRVKDHFAGLRLGISFNFTEREGGFAAFIGGLVNMLVARQKFEIPWLAAKQRLLERFKTISLDRELQDEEGKAVTLGDLIPAHQNPEEATPAYLRAVERLPAEIQPIFSRCLYSGESPKEAAVHLGFQWTPALERQLQRAKRNLFKQMLG